MTLSALHVGSATRHLLAVESLAAPEVSLVCRTTRQPFCEAGDVDVGGRLGFWCAYYGPQIRANGWEPYDQPTPAAYMPCRYADFEVLHLDGGGALLVQRSVRRSHALIRRSHPGLSAVAVDVTSAGAVGSKLSSLLQAFEIPRGEVSAILPFVLARCEELFDRVAAA
jgi:hypothetical protein